MLIHDLYVMYLCKIIHMKYVEFCVMHVSYRH